jgi:hypothetical protein
VSRVFGAAGGGSTGARYRRVALVAVAAALTAGASAQPRQATWLPDRADETTVRSVWTYIEHKDCAEAARLLSEGVRAGRPLTMVLAGAMFEEGVCLRRSWPKALEQYERAHAAGHPRAAARIASGYATDAAGPDRAAALWWALGRIALPPACRSAEGLKDDPDRFVAALREWPAGLLERCSYVVGVVGTVTGDLEFSSRAAGHGLHGRVVVDYWPADDRVELVDQDLQQAQLGGLVSADVVRDGATRSVRSTFESDIRAVFDRGRQRMTRPTGLDPSWKLRLDFNFTYGVR